MNLALILLICFIGLESHGSFGEPIRNRRIASSPTATESPIVSVLKQVSKSNQGSLKNGGSMGSDEANQRYLTVIEYDDPEKDPDDDDDDDDDDDPYDYESGRLKSSEGEDGDEEGHLKLDIVDEPDEKKQEEAEETDNNTDAVDPDFDSVPPKKKADPKKHGQSKQPQSQVYLVETKASDPIDKSPSNANKPSSSKDSDDTKKLAKPNDDKSPSHGKTFGMTGEKKLLGPAKDQFPTEKPVHTSGNGKEELKNMDSGQLKHGKVKKAAEAEKSENKEEIERSEAGGVSSIPIIVAVVCIVLVILVSVVAFVVIRRRNRQTVGPDDNGAGVDTSRDPKQFNKSRCDHIRSKQSLSYRKGRLERDEPDGDTQLPSVNNLNTPQSQP